MPTPLALGVGGAQRDDVRVIGRAPGATPDTSRLKLAAVTTTIKPPACPFPHTGDTAGIDRVVHRVVAMYEPIESISFNVFDYGNQHEWKAAKQQFYADNEDIKEATRELIDTSFRKLRSAEGACELLQSFKSIKSKGAIQKQVGLGRRAQAGYARREG